MSKRGVVQRELREALEVMRDLPEGSVFIIPVRLQRVEPRHELLRSIHRVDLFLSWDEGVRRLGIALTTHQALSNAHSSATNEIGAVPTRLASLPRQYAAVCYRLSSGNVELLLVRTSAGRWTFPKGRPDVGRQGYETAENEAYEEAGVRGTVEREPFHTYLHAKTGKKRFKREDFAVEAFLMNVQDTLEVPEPDRNPTWFTPATAKRVLAEGRELTYAKSLEETVDAAVAKIRQAPQA